MYFIVNFKNYPEAAGQAAVDLVGRLISATSQHPNATLMVCPAASDIYRIREKYPHLLIWAQHIDPTTGSKTTGWTSPASIGLAGATGTLVNHSEHPLSEDGIKLVMEHCRQIGISTCLCVANLDTAKHLKQYRPDMIAYEPPELIASGHSLAEVDPTLAADFVNQLNDFDGELILGAGISNSRDVNMAKALGYKGVLLASAITTSSDQAAKVHELLADI